MTKRQKRGATLLAVGVLLVLIGLGIHYFHEQEDLNAGKTATLLLNYLEQKTLSVDPEPGTQAEKEALKQKLTPPDNDPKLPVKTYMGYALIGSISIPSVGIDLPIMKDWSYDMLKIAPCRYQGSISGGNLIVMGHNYKRHFTPLHSVKVGAEVVFENTDGTFFRYRVAEIEFLHRTEGEDLPSDYPLTLFTCTASGLDRIIVRCELVK